MFAVNADAVFHCCKAALEDLVAAPRGRIVTIASTAGLRGFPYTAGYGAAKHAAVGLMRMIAQDYANAGLTANAVCPGFTDTALVDESAARTAEMAGMTKDQIKASMGGLNPCGRLIQPAEIAALMVELHPLRPERRSGRDRMTEVLAIREKHDGALADRSSVRLWLRLLSCTMAIEKDVQRRLGLRGATLARFDVLAALDRHAEGMTMGALSRALLVSNGNVTQLVQKLAKDRLVRIAPSRRRPARLDRPVDRERPGRFRRSRRGSSRLDRRVARRHGCGDPRNSLSGAWRAQAIDRERTVPWILKPSARRISNGIIPAASPR